MYVKILHPVFAYTHVTLFCPKLRPATLAQELERREEKRTISDLRFSHVARRTTPMSAIILQIKYFEIHSVKQAIQLYTVNTGKVEKFEQ